MKKILFILFTIFMLPAMAMKKLSPEEQLSLNTKLANQGWRTIVHSDEEERAKITELLALGADPNAQDSEGRTCLLNQAFCANLEACKCLVKAGADVNAQTLTGLTPLHCALHCTNPHDTVPFLIKHGAKINVKCTEDGDYNGTPFQVSLKRDDHKMSRLRSMIIDSKFTPYCTNRQLRDAQCRTRARLSVLPKLPKEILTLILASNQEVWHDACCTPLQIHQNKHDRIPQMPLQVIRTLIHCKALNPDITVATLKAHKFEQLKGINTPMMLNLDFLVAKFVKAIEEVIKADCQISTPEEK